MTNRLLILATIALTSIACEPKGKVGEACTVVGDGFTRADSCADMCVAWEVECPDGSLVTPDVCAGAVCGASGTCPQGQFCLQVDSFATNSRCMPVEVCGLPAGPASESAPTLPAEDEARERQLR